jgi:hypothetical protein
MYKQPFATKNLDGQDFWEKPVTVPSSIPGPLTVTSSVASTSKTTGALIVPNGGLGVGGDTFCGRVVAENSGSNVHTFIGNTAGSAPNSVTSFIIQNKSTTGKSAITFYDTAGATPFGSVGYNNASSTNNPSSLTLQSGGGTIPVRILRSSVLHIDCKTTGTTDFPTNVASTSTTTGTITAAGGLGVVGNAYVGGDLVMPGTTTTFRPPSLTTVQRDAIATPVAGMVIYNTTTGTLNFYNTAWRAVSFT